MTRSGLVLAGVALLVCSGCWLMPNLTGGEQTTSVPDGESGGLVYDNTQFAFDLYRHPKISGEPGNVLFSPYSLSTALAMTYAGARGDTEQEMKETLHFLLPQEDLHPAFHALDLELDQRSGIVVENDVELGEIVLNVLNQLWGQEGFTFLSSFLDSLAQNYDATLRLLDFCGATEESRATINNWVADNTAQRILDLIPPGALDCDTRLVLTNVVYFKAPWADAFLPGNTRDEEFHLLDGMRVSVPMMHREAYFRYGRGLAYQAVELPYVGDELAMLIMVPNEGLLAAFEATLNADRLNAIVNGLTSQKVHLGVPKFTFEWSETLKGILSDLGMPTAFTPAADFSGMNGVRGLFISAVLHKAYIGVDEDGTEAAAATAIVMPGSSPVQPIPVVLTIDRPFVFVIRDRATGTILFLGRVVDPR